MTQTKYAVRISGKPADYAVISAIKSIRTLTGLSLKEVTTAFSSGATISAPVLPNISSSVRDENIRNLEMHGLEVDSSASLLQDMRDFAKRALDLGMDEIADEILSIILSEKLKNI